MEAGTGAHKRDGYKVGDTWFELHGYARMPINLQSTPRAPFLIDNGRPRITDLSAKYRRGKLELSAQAEDDISRLVEAQYSVDGRPWLSLSARDGHVDDRLERLSDTVACAENGRSCRSVAVRVKDAAGNEATQATDVRGAPLN